MNFMIIISIIIVFLVPIVQSMTFRDQNHIKNVYQSNEQKVKQKKIFLIETSPKAALESFSKCQKLRVKLMIKYRNRPRLLRRISKLTLEC